uniref:Uncharacterized protein n=1 Tax=Aegilops tauschii subsp. strangulata TaxID=200361 RepID=A0A453Q5Q4_AEGTS
MLLICGRLTEVYWRSGAEAELQVRHRRDMAAAAGKEVDMKKMELMKEVRAHQVAIGELNNLPPSRVSIPPPPGPGELFY